MTTPPEWLNRDFFQKVLKSYEKDDRIQITNMSIKIASKNCEQFTSLLYQVKLVYLTKFDKELNIQLIVKTIPFGDVAANKPPLDEAVFETEIKMYTKTIPEIRKYLQLALDDRDFFPKLIYQSKEPNMVIVLEDISVKGYHLLGKQLNLQGSKVVLSRLAKWHAISILLEQKTNDLSTYRQGVFRVRPDSVNHMLDSVTKFLEELRTWPDYEIYVEKFENIQRKFEEKLLRLYVVNAPHNGYNVLNHGDFHIRNMMFQTDKDDNIRDFILFDYQVCVWGSPALDLIYALYMVASRETLENDRETLLSYYYQEFIASFKKLGLKEKIPTTLDFNTEMMRHGFLEVIIAVCFMPFIYADLGKVKVEEILANNDSAHDRRRALYAHPEYKNIIQELLPVYLAKGFLD